MCSKILRGIESDLTYANLLGVDSQYILRSGSSCRPESSNFKTNVCFLPMTIELGVANNHTKITSTNTSLNNNLRSLKGDILYLLAY